MFGIVDTYINDILLYIFYWYIPEYITYIYITYIYITYIYIYIYIYYIYIYILHIYIYIYIIICIYYITNNHLGVYLVCLMGQMMINRWMTFVFDDFQVSIPPRQMIAITLWKLIVLLLLYLPKIPFLSSGTWGLGCNLVSLHRSNRSCLVSWFFWNT